MRVPLIIFLELLMCLAAVLAYDLWPSTLVLPSARIPQTVEACETQTVISWRGYSLVGELAEYDDPLFAYLMFDHFRSQTLLRGTPVMLTVNRDAPKAAYHILVRLPNDLVSGLTKLAVFRATNLVAPLNQDRSLRYDWITSSALWSDQHQTALFNEAYSEPPSQGLEQLPAAELRPYVSQFIRFKSATDPRTWKVSRFVLSPVTAARADHLADDIIAVADFYNIPVEVFLGIGAMENNFLDAPGDLDNAIWRRHPEPDDIVLQRKGRRAWILNSSAGIWQITRQSLRHAQKLFLADDRDYSRLPEHLRPEKQLDLENTDEVLLTTYAGLLLRELLDKFDGDVTSAVGAYNGTVDHPNVQYASGVQMVADYARRVIGCTVDLSRIAAAQAAVVDQTDVNASPLNPISSKN